MASPNNDIPVDVLRIIIKKAELDIDTRLKLRVKPSKIKNNNLSLFSKKINEIHVRRKKAWDIYEDYRKRMDGSVCALDYFKSPSIDIGIRMSTHISFGIWYIDDELKYSIEANEIILQDPLDQLAHMLPVDDGELFVRRSECYVMHSGAPCPKIFDDDDDSYDDEY